MSLQIWHRAALEARTKLPLPSWQDQALGSSGSQTQLPLLYPPKKPDVSLRADTDEGATCMRQLLNLVHAVG